MKNGKKKLYVIICVAMVLLCMMERSFCEKSFRTCLPLLVFRQQENGEGYYARQMQKFLFPLTCVEKEDVIVARRMDRFLLDKMKPVEILTLMEVENQAGNHGTHTDSAPVLESVKEEESVVLQTPVPTATPSPSEPVPAFVPHTLQTIVDMKELENHESLMKRFYVVDSVAMVGSELLDANTLADVDLRITKESEGPQILIYHTHSQEGYVDSVPGDDRTTIMGVGEYLAEILRTRYGYNVLHHMGKYDVESRDNAYSRSLPEIEKVLQENPSIQVVIDLHRDAVADESNKLLMDLDGRPTARFMFFNGVSCTKKTGNIDYLYNPHLKENLAFSFQMKKVAEEYYPGLTRKNYIHGYRYNMHLCPKTTLIELGAQNNTLQEAMNACEPIAHILDMVLSGASVLKGKNNSH